MLSTVIWCGNLAAKRKKNYRLGKGKFAVFNKFSVKRSDISVYVVAY